MNISESTGVLISIVGSGRYIYTNDLIAKVLGYSNSEMKNIRPVDIIYKNDMAAMKKNGIMLLLGIKKEIHFSGHFVRKNKELLQADLIFIKHKTKESKKSYMVALLDNIKELAPSESGDS